MDTIIKKGSLGFCKKDRLSSLRVLGRVGRWAPPLDPLSQPRVGQEIRDKFW